MRQIVSISLDPETLRLIDKARGLIKRSNWIEHKLREALGAEDPA